MPIYCKLFNLILNTGKIPNSWSEGIILPIYENKGSVSEPSSYRPITIQCNTLVSCLGKTFTTILNNRLSQLSDEIELITEVQTGFRKDYGTIDNIFTLYALFSIYQSLGKKLHCTFVDFSKAFDSISRAALWVKLQNADINGQLLKVMHNLYDNVKSCVRNNQEYSAFFRCDIGVRQ